MKFIVFRETILENKRLEPKNGALGRWCSNSNWVIFEVQPVPFIFSQKPGFGDRKIWKLPRPRPRNFPRTWHVKLSMSSRPVGKEFTFLPVKKKKPCKPLEKRVPEITHFLMLYLMIQWSSGKNQINNYRWTIINLVTRPRYVIKKYQKVGAI